MLISVINFISCQWRDMEISDAEKVEIEDIEVLCTVDSVLLVNAS